MTPRMRRDCLKMANMSVSELEFEMKFELEFKLKFNLFNEGR